MFTSELELFSISINILTLDVVNVIVVNTIQIERTTNIIVLIVKTEANHIGSLKTIVEKKLEVALENKVYIETYYQHKLSQVQIDETLVKVKVQELQIAKWTLTKNQQLLKINLGIKDNPQTIKNNAQLVGEHELFKRIVEQDITR